MTPPSNFRTAACSVLAVALLTMPGIARAGTPCDADIKKLCADVSVGSGRVQECLKKHKKELSSECSGWYENLEKTTGGIAASCRNDIARFCKGVAPGGGRVADCLEKHRSELDATCSEQLHKAPKPK